MWEKSRKFSRISKELLWKLKTAPAVISLIRRNLIFSTQCRRKHQNYAPATNFGAGYPRSDKNQSPLRLFKPEFYRKISGAHNRKPHTRYFREDSIRKAGKVKRVSRRADAGRLLVRHHSSNQWCAGFRGRVEGRTAVTGNAVYTSCIRKHCTHRAIRSFPKENRSLHPF